MILWRLITGIRAFPTILGADIEVSALCLTISKSLAELAIKNFAVYQLTEKSN